MKDSTSRSFIIILLIGFALLIPFSVLASAQTGTAIWRSNASTIPLQSTWNGSSFDGSSATADVGDYRVMAGAEAPLRDEKIIVGVTESSNISGMIYSSGSWAAFPFNDMATVSESFWWGFAVAYEQISGDAMLVWNNGDTDTAGISYRIWNGTVWSAEDTIMILPESGEPQHMRIAASPLSDEMVLIVSNDASKDYALVWDGSEWGNPVPLSTSGASNDRTDVFVKYEHISGHAVVVYSTGAATILKTKVWDGSEWLLTALDANIPVGLSGYSRWATLASDPNSDRIALGVLTSSGHIWLNIWDGESWGSSDSATTAAVGTTFPNVAVAFEGASGDLIAVYGEADGVKTRLWDGSDWGDETMVVDLGAPPNSMFLDTRQYSDEIMLSVQDDDEDLSLVFWDGDSWGTANELETATTEYKNQPFVFLWDMEPPLNRAPVLAEIGPKSVQEGENLNFGISATDPDGTTPELDAENVPTNAEFTDNGDGTGTFDFNPDFDQQGSYSVRFIASDGELADTEVVVITVDSVSRPPVLTAIGSQTVEEGQNLNFEITASDPDATTPSLLAENLPTNANFTDNGDGSGTFDFDAAFDQAGAYSVRFIATDGALADTELVEITVTPDPLNYIVIEPDSTVVSADSTRQFTVTGYDGGDNEVDPGTITWELTESLGTIDGSGEFDAVTVGLGKVIATSSLGPVDTSACLEVIPGALAVLAVSPDTDTISADLTRQFTANGTDSDGNGVSELGDLTWQVLGGIGTINASGLFTAVHAGNGSIKVTSDLGVSDVSGVITVTPGDPAFVEVTPGASVVMEDSSIQFTALVYDSDSNLVSNATASATWTTTDPSGYVTGGLYTAGTNPSPPNYFVRAVAGGLADSSVVTVISSGSLSYIQVEWSDGTLFENTTLTTDNDTIKIYCRGYDSGDNLLGDISVAWSFVGSDSVGAIVTGPDTRTNLTLVKPGSCKIAATFSGSLADTTGVISCIPGTTVQMVISPDTATVTADASIQFEYDLYDADGNATGEMISKAWDVLGDIGTIAGSGLFSASNAGTGYITCTGGGLADTTGEITVVAGELSWIEISPDSISLSVGESANFDANGFDADSNAADVGNLTWDVIGDIGEINPSGKFFAATPGLGRISVTSSIGGISDTNRAVVVEEPTLEMMVVSPDTASVSLYGTVAFAATGYDSQYDPAAVGDLTWKVIGGIGSIDANGIFTATTKGAGWIIATSSINNISDTTNMVVVEVPTVSVIPLGNTYVHPDESTSCILAFRITNAFDVSTAIDRVTLRIASRGAGSASQLLMNIDSLVLYADANGDDQLDASDQFISGAAVSTETVTLSFAPLTIGPGSELVLFGSVNTSLYARDSDSLDILMLPASDIHTTDGSPIAGPGTVNSLGYNIVDGLVASQLSLVSLGNSTAIPGEKSVNLMTIDIPRNGYSQDILNILSVYNAGNATQDDVASMLLYRDNGNGSWGGATEESVVGSLAYTGNLWSVSGLSVPLADQTNRFFVAANISDSPANGKTFALGIPLKGIEMSSDNDGPTDRRMEAIDTILISNSEMLNVRVVTIPSHNLIPGKSTGPLAGIELVNTYPIDITIDSIRCSSFAVDPHGATQAQLDSQFDNLSLWRNLDGDFAVEGGSDLQIATAQLSDGSAKFSLGDIVVPANGGVVGLFIEADLNAVNAKNDNTIAPGIVEAAHIYQSQGANIAGSFPMRNPDDFMINAFPAAAITVDAIDSKTLYGGQTDEVILDFELPRDGYSAAILEGLRLINAGSADEALVLESVMLRADSDGNGVLSAADATVGEFSYTGSVWRMFSGAHVLTQELNRLFVTVNVAEDNFAGGTLQFVIPTGGVTFASGTTGPDDQAVSNPEAHLLYPSDRITLISIPMETSTIAPGSDDNIVLSFAMYNGYHDQAQTLQSVRLSNISKSWSSVQYSDFELGQLSLYYDQNKNRMLDDDLFVSSGYFSGGTLNLTGVDILLEGESISHFFAVFDLPLDAIDQDSLQIGIVTESDLVFESTVNINGDLPLTSGGCAVVDGSVRDQYQLLPVSSRTVSPGDTSICMFAFRPSPNGDLVDTLVSLKIENAGEADPEDVAKLELWMDADADDLWENDDIYLGDFSITGYFWEIGPISIETVKGSTSLFVVGDISESANSDVAFRASVPLFGCEYNSENDGPRDHPLVADQEFIISGSRLHLTYVPLGSSYTTGQEIEILATVTNLSTETIEDVYLEAVPSGDVDAVVLTENSIGPITLSSGQSAEYYCIYDAVQSGTVSWQLRAYSSSTLESSAQVPTRSVTIQEAPTAITIQMISSTPTAVALGQSHVFPLSIRYSHPDTLITSTPLRLDSLRIGIQDGAGVPLPANEVFSRMILATGYTNLSILESIPDESSVLLVFDMPAIVGAGDTKLLSLQVDIDSFAVASDFSISIENASSIAIVDNNTGQSIPIHQSVNFPLSTDVCRVDIPSENAMISYVSVLNETVNYGQQNVGVLDLVLRHPGVPRNSQIQMTGLSVGFVDQEGSPVIASELIESVRLMRQRSIIGQTTCSVSDSTTVSTQLTAPLSLSPGQIDTIRIEISVAEIAPFTGFGLVIEDSTQIVVRDLISGSVLEATGDTNSLLAGTVFPITSGIAQLNHPASTPELCLTSALPPSIVAGSDQVPLVDLDILYPAESNQSSIALRRVCLALADSAGDYLNPMNLFDRIGYQVSSDVVAYQQHILMENGQIVFELDEEQIIVDPGESLTVRLVADVDAGAPYDDFVLTMQEQQRITTVDATDTTSNLGFTQSVDCEFAFPFSTGHSRLLLPSGRPVLTVEIDPVQIAAPGQYGLILPIGELSYQSPDPQGDVLMKSWCGRILKRTATGFGEASAAAIFKAIHLLIDEQVVATDSTFTGDSLRLDPDEEFVLTHGGSWSVAISYDIKPNAPGGNHLISFDDSSFIELLDRDQLTEVDPVLLGAEYPLLTGEISLVQADLGNSFTNYPNPFMPGTGEITRIAYVLPEDAHVDIEIFTITGDLVKKLVDNSFRSSGPNQDDIWDGYNGSGSMIVSGTYFCRITARYVSGGEESHRRKIAVIR